MARRRRPPRPGAANELPPLRILGQIAALQSIYYAAALVLMLFTSLVAGTQFSLDLVFGWANLRGDTTQGWLMGFVWLCCAGVTFVTSIPDSENNINNMIQCCRDSRLNRPIKARTRFRTFSPLHPSHYRHIIYRLPTTTRCLVGYDGSLERCDRNGRNLRLPMEGIAAY